MLVTKIIKSLVYAIKSSLRYIAHHFRKSFLSKFEYQFALSDLFNEYLSCNLSVINEDISEMIKYTNSFTSSCLLHIVRFEIWFDHE